MAGRTYLPTIVHLLHKLCVYIARYRMAIIQYLPEGGEAKLDAIVLACEAFMAIVPDNTLP